MSWQHTRIAILFTSFLGMSAAQDGAAPHSGQRSELEAADSAFRAKDWPVAAAAYQKLASSQADSGMAHFRLGVARLYLGQLDSGLAELDTAEKLAWLVAQVAYRKACAHAASHNLDKSFAEMERALQAGFGLVALAEQDPLLAGLRADSRWPPLRDRIERSAHRRRKDLDSQLRPDIHAARAPISSGWLPIRRN